MSAPLNLASHPVRNERLPALLLGVALVALLVVTVEQVLWIVRLLPSRTSALDHEVAGLDAEETRLRTEVASLRGPKPDPAVLKQWAFVKGLVDRRAFSWTDLFARLGEVLPPGVRLLSIAPSVREGDLRLELQAVARTAEDGFSFLQALQQRPEFPDVNLLSVGDSEEGAELTYSMKYVATAKPAAAKGAQP